MNDNEVTRQIMAEHWRLDTERRSASTSALEAIAEQQRPAREALHEKCGVATGHNMNTTGYTVGGLAMARSPQGPDALARVGANEDRVAIERR